MPMKSLTETIHNSKHSPCNFSMELYKVDVNKVNFLNKSMSIK